MSSWAATRRLVEKAYKQPSIKRGSERIIVAKLLIVKCFCDRQDIENRCLSEPLGNLFPAYNGPGVYPRKVHLPYIRNLTVD